jgi:predicted amino acid dehydrogenase
MTKLSFLALALGAGVAFTGAPATVSAKPVSFDGTWNVRLVTESGTCDNSYSHTVAIENGRVRTLGGAESATAISGGVGNDGSVALTISRSIAQADASGRLGSRSGSGSWKLAMLGCTGRWSASRA